MHADVDVLPVLDIGSPRAPAASPALPAQTWHDGFGRLVARGGRDSGSWWMEWPGLGTFTFGTNGPVTAHPVAAGLEDRLRDSFLRGVLPVALLGRGFEALHASAVDGPHGVVALCATSGTGKSTLALALAGEGFPHWSDDTVVYHLPDHHPVTLRLPCVPRIDDVPRGSAGNRAVSATPLQTRRLARIYHLVRDERLDPLQPAFSLVPPARRFERLLAHAHPFDMGPDERRRAFISTLLEIARRVDCWECSFASSLAALPSLAKAVRHHIESA